jgi:hypothetical protein
VSVSGSFAQRDLIAIGGVEGDVVLGGTLHKHYHYGTRGYVIEKFPTRSPLDVEWLMAQPSRLLDARSQVVDFVGRQQELRLLREWRDGGSRLSALLVHGPGGQGKTRLAAEFADESRNPSLPAANRWMVLQARLQGVAPSSFRVTDADLVDSAAGILLIVDYADRWAHEELRRLFAHPVLQQRPVRLLLLGRTVRWYAAIRYELGKQHHASADDVELRHLAADRVSVFSDARNRYAKPDLYNRPDANEIPPPTSLEHDDFGLVLTLHMAALVAVDARCRPPSDPHRLSAYLLDREYAAWERLSTAGKHGQDYRTRPIVMRKTVFTAVLTGPVEYDVGEHALNLSNLQNPQELLLDHRFCYPPVNRELVLEPLYPDRLAEDFLGLLVPGHDITGYDPDPWAKAISATLLTSKASIRSVIASRAVTFLASAANRWPHIGDKVLYPLLRSDPGLAVDAGGAALSAVAAIKGIDMRILEKIAEMSDPHSDISLDVGMADVLERVIEHKLAGTSDPRRRAELYEQLAMHRARASRREDMAEAIRNAGKIYHELSLDDPEKFDPHRARCLCTYSMVLADLGLFDKAHLAAEQAVEIYERFTRVAPGRYESRLVDALKTLSHRLSDLRRDDESENVAQRATRLSLQLESAQGRRRPGWRRRIFGRRSETRENEPSSPEQVYVMIE